MLYLFPFSPPGLNLLLQTASSAESSPALYEHGPKAHGRAVRGLIRMFSLVHTPRQKYVSINTGARLQGGNPVEHSHKCTGSGGEASWGLAGWAVNLGAGAGVCKASYFASAFTILLCPCLGERPNPGAEET